MKNNKFSLALLAIVTTFIFFTENVYSSNSVKVNFKGNLISNPPCDITGVDGNEITVDFKDMVIRRITGMTYIQEVKYKLTCDAPDNTGISLKIIGDTAGFYSGLLKTNNDNLGIRFHVGDDYYPIRVNTDPVKFTNNNHNKIYANPIINADATNIKAGVFTSTATILAEYQ